MRAIIATLTLLSVAACAELQDAATICLEQNGEAIAAETEINGDVLLRYLEACAL